MGLTAHQRIGSYEIIAPLGSGAMATVYKVRHVQLQAIYALKLLHRSDGQVQERLLQEGRVQATLRHPNVVAVTDIVEHEGQPGLVMEYVDGPTLAQYLAEHHPISADTLDALVRPILKGVRAAHRAGTIHRDLKPANILVAGRGDELIPKVADFGLVKDLEAITDSTHTRTGAILGSPAYMAPEQTLASGQVDQRADVWALGATFYQLATGKLPFRHDDLITLFSMVRGGRFDDPRALRPDVPERMWAAIEGALAVDVDHRIRDCDELLAVWDGAARPRMVVDSADTIGHDFPTPARPPPRPPTTSSSGASVDLVLSASNEAPGEPPSRPASSSHTWLAVAGALTVALAVAIAGVVGAASLVVSQVPQAPPEPVAAPVKAPEPLPSAPPPEPAPPEPVAPAVAVPSVSATHAVPRPTAPIEPPPVALPAPPVGLAAPPVAASGTFAATGQAEAVWLVRGGTYYEPGELPAGSYTVAARFPGRPAAPVDGVVVHVGEGQHVKLSCVAGFFTCKVQAP